MLEVKEAKKVLDEAYFFIPDASPSSFYRFVFPLRHFRSQGLKPHLSAVIQPDYFEKGRVFFFQRVADRSLFDLSLALKNQPRAMVFDLDTYIEPPPYHPNYHFYHSMKPYLEMVIQSASFLTVPTLKLKEELKDYNENIFVLPNKYSREVLEGVREVEKTKLKLEAGLPSHSVVIGWAGAPFSLHELAFLERVLNRLFEKFNYLYFAVWESEPQFLSLPQERRVKFDFLPLSSLFVSLGLVDIGIIPAENTLFNQCKSGRMVFEYGLAKTAVLAQKIEPFENLKGKGAPIELAGSDKEWEEKLVEMIKEDEKRFRRGEELRKWVESNCFFGEKEEEWEVFLKKLAEVLE